MKWQPTPVFLPGKAHGQRSLVDCRTGTAWEAFINSMHILLEGVKLSFVNPGQGNYTLIMLCRLEYATKTRVTDSQPPREIELVTFS